MKLKLNPKLLMAWELTCDVSLSLYDVVIEQYKKHLALRILIWLFAASLVISQFATWYQDSEISLHKYRRLEGHVNNTMIVLIRDAAADGKITEREYGVINDMNHYLINKQTKDAILKGY